MGHDVRVARRGALDRRRRRHARAAFSRRATSAALVRRCARSRRRFHDLCSGAGLCAGRERPIAASARGSLEHRDRGVGRDLLRRPQDEAARQFVPRLSHSLERDCVSSVRDQVFALGHGGNRRGFCDPDLRAVPDHSSLAHAAYADPQCAGASCLGRARSLCTRCAASIRDHGSRPRSPPSGFIFSAPVLFFPRIRSSRSDRCWNC